ncbi:glutamine synthetase [Nocardia panacis]|uniref:Glutamine synthetase n=1 Tax=Nocardia panacis TaxID=2340916 RepID=A0A3A4K2X2_9NOCA|nr:glutamine synthetase family protein [Nocardia panacis]RJO79163.1 glutamine synthetase [Nocardia panacis]
MDIDAFLNEPGRDDAINEVRKLIDRLEIQYIYVQFSSVTGRVVGKGMPATQWAQLAEKGVQLVYGAISNVSVDRRGRYLGYGPEASELIALPEPETFAQLPWDGRVARVFARLFRNREEVDLPGAALATDCRGNLARLDAEFTDRHGMSMRLGTEPEMMWLRRGANGELMGVTEPYCYHVDQLEELREVILRVLRYGHALGLDMIQGDHEDAPGQLEMNFRYDAALRNADRLITYRQICRQVAREFGLIACFMTKPFAGLSASGCHHNLSLWRDGDQEVLPTDIETTMAGVRNHCVGGVNMLTVDREADPNLRSLNDVGRRAVGGLVAHLPALTALGASTVNSYRRLRDTGLWAPVEAGWGYQNRTCAIRISAPDRIEYRMADSMVNPYLMAAGLMAAIDDGLRGDLDPGPPTSANTYDNSPTSRRRLPMSLGEALAALDDDDVVRSALPEELYRVYTSHKRDEWDRFLSTVTEWDFETYLDYIP